MASIFSKVTKAGIILTCGFIMSSAENLLVNSSFEDGAVGWQQWGAVSTQHSYAGAKAMEVTNSSAQWSGISQELPILENATSVTITGWMKTENVISGNEEWEKAQIAIEYLDENGVEIKQYPEQVALKSGSEDWTYYEKSYTLYDGAAIIKLVAALGNATGKVSFDQFSLIQKKADGTELLRTDLQAHYEKEQANQANTVSVTQNGSFEFGNRDWDSYNAEFTEVGRNGSSALLINNSNYQWGGASQVIALPEEAASMVVSGWTKCDSVIRGKEGWDKAILNFEFQDDTGAKVGEYPQAVAELEGSSDWKYYQRKYAVNSEASRIKLTCQLCNSKGKVVFDDISVVLYDSVGRELE